MLKKCGRREAGFPWNKNWRLAKEFLYLIFREMLNANKDEETMTI